MSIAEDFQEIARQELARGRRRLGQFTPEQEHAVESLLMCTVDKISRPLVKHFERLFGPVPTESANIRRQRHARLKEGASGVRQIIEPVLDEG